MACGSQLLHPVGFVSGETGREGVMSTKGNVCFFLVEKQPNLQDAKKKSFPSSNFLAWMVLAKNGIKIWVDTNLMNVMTSSLALVLETGRAHDID